MVGAIDARLEAIHTAVEGNHETLRKAIDGINVRLDSIKEAQAAAATAAPAPAPPPAVAPAAEEGGGEGGE